jgi:hypothetical protein
MDVYSTELGIRLSFVKTSEFRGGGGLNPNPPRYATAGAHPASYTMGTRYLPGAKAAGGVVLITHPPF